ncbi:ty3-gypsy retrotransposon protein [Tanacetum coccineum]|uniref:Ty3-gypsy retrotransposon protein n=1 Tax=Tanacetum coccineum TaxID=301880 RepID=A0ABQ5EGF6_9ASTR
MMKIINSPSLDSSIDERKSLEVMCTNKRYAWPNCKVSKVQCEEEKRAFHRVATYPTMVEWPIPTTLKQPRGCIGLTGYYRSFIKNYAAITQPLTTAMKKALVLQLPKFDVPLVVEMDALCIGKENQAADALSRKTHGGELSTLVVSSISTSLIEEVQQSLEHDSKLQDLIRQLQDGSSTFKYTWSAGQLRRKGKLVGGYVDNIKVKLVERFHGSTEGGHLGVVANRLETKNLVLLERLRKTVKKIASQWDKVWQDISMDFIDGLPTSNGKTVIMVVVDRLNKYTHFMAMSHPYTSVQVAQLFLDNVYRLHGLTHTIISDRDKVFTSLFWKSLFQMLKVELKMSSAYHPQTYGQKEAVNKCLECYLRCIIGDKPKYWTKWLPIVEFWYNTKFYSYTKTTLYEIVYGQTPPQYVSYEVGEYRVEAVDITLVAGDQAVRLLQIYLIKAQNKMCGNHNRGG